MKKLLLSLSIVVCIILIILIIPKQYDCKIIEYKVVAQKEAYITYEVINNTNKESTLRVYSSIEKNGVKVAEKITYIVVKANSKKQMTVVLTTERNTSFYGSKAKIKVEKSIL